eukprot:gb/GEZN01009555.1/.p1 GENE.gb/GEZN01009555.1/~~gb/GEZN01009555.1/.p1  ORF type:complete len:405 (+),score=26.29 gb/GEZN01009555.1/:64-1278(+)
MLPRALRFTQQPLRKQARPLTSTQFNYKPSDKIRGEVLRHSLDIRRAEIGNVIEVPYEITVTDAWRTMWQASFYQHDRLYTSEPYARNLELQACPLPFSLMLAQTVTMSHLDDSKNILDLSFDNAIYVRPAYVGQTFRKQFVISRLKPANNGANAHATFKCKLYNAETDELVFVANKSMIIYGTQLEPWQSQRAPSKPPPPAESKFLKHLVAKSGNLDPHMFISKVETDQLIIHQHQRTLGYSESRQLSTLFRLTHPVAFNVARYGEPGIVLFGALSLSTVFSLASVKLYETMYEEIHSCLFVATTHPRDCIGALSLITDIKSRENGLEELTVYTVGIKNVDAVRTLKDYPIPRVLFTGDLKPSQVRQLCKNECPLLSDKVFLVSKRKIWRQAAFLNESYIPLL